MRCPRCKSTHIVKIGMIVNRYGKRQRFKCWECGTTFYANKSKRSKK